MGESLSSVVVIVRKSSWANEGELQMDRMALQQTNFFCIAICFVKEGEKATRLCRGTF